MALLTCSISEIPPWGGWAGRYHHPSAVPVLEGSWPLGSLCSPLSTGGKLEHAGGPWDVWSTHCVRGTICPQSCQHPCEAARSYCPCFPVGGQRQRGQEWPGQGPWSQPIAGAPPRCTVLSGRRLGSTAQRTLLDLYKLGSLCCLGE